MDKDPLEPFVSKRLPGDKFIDKDWCLHESATALMQSTLGFCVCGRPENNLLYIRNGLRKIRNFSNENLDFHTWHEQCKAIFGSYEAAYFFFYWADKEELTEHGVSMPGWLTSKGEQILEALESLPLDGEEELI